MDPNETLRLIRLTIKQMRVDEHPAIREAHADEVAEHFEALDTWLSGGGFPPEAWREGPDAPVELPDHECIYCGEPIEYRDGEWVQKYGNDPQCDESRSRNGNHLPRKRESESSS